MAETTEQTHKVTEDGTVLVPLKLAHPMAKHYAEHARVENPRDYKVGDTIWVGRDYGNALIDGGFVQVDPVDTKGRQRALLLTPRNSPLTAKEIEALLAREAEGSDGGADSAGPARLEGHQSEADAPSKETPAKSSRTGK